MFDYWQVKRGTVVVAHGPKDTAPDKELRTSLRKSGHKIYVDGKLCKS